MTGTGIGAAIGDAQQIGEVVLAEVRRFDELAQHGWDEKYVGHLLVLAELEPLLWIELAHDH
jgi:hypothetical protein